MTNDHVTLREIMTGDLPVLEKIEARSHLRRDPDFGVVCVSQHAWDRETIRSVLVEPRSHGYVLEEGEDNVVGYYVVEAEADGYLLRRLVVHPDYRDANMGRTVLYRLYRKAKQSRTRKTLRAVVREDDLATCEWLKHMGFYSRLVRGGWDATLDAVEFYFRVTVQEGGGPEGVASAGEEEA